MKLKQYTAKTIRTALGILMVSGMAVLPAGCSDNDEPGLYAADNSNISLAVEASGLANGLIEIGSAQSSTVVNVTSTTRWTVEVSNCEGAWCQIVYGDMTSDEAGHIGSGIFRIEAAPNRSGNVRECDVTVYAVDSEGNHLPGRSVLIHVEQDRQSIQVDYAGDVISPLGTTPATQPQVTVTANQAWRVSSSHAWVTVIPGEGMDGDTFIPAAGSSENAKASFRLSVEGNPGTSVRYAEVTVSSPTSAFTPIRLNVTQEGSSDTFFVTPTSTPTVSWRGDTIEFRVYSPREAWTVKAVSAGEWVSLDRTSGEASSEAVTIRAKVLQNEERDSRQAGVIFTRAGGMGETIVTIDQNGNPDVPVTPDLPEVDPHPSVSSPWVISGWTQTWAQVRAYYSSPYITVTGCGAFCHPVDNPDDVRNVHGSLGENNQIIVDLTDLTPNTEYCVWCYVEYTFEGQSMVTTGGAVYFTTPDKTGQPGSGDNNPPSVN